MRYRAVQQGRSIPEKHCAPVYERFDSHLSGKLLLLVIKPFASEDPGQTAEALDESHCDA